jgi:hypothetical protein
MSYENDVFISYRREKNAWTPWARDIFKSALESCLQRELGDPPNIFIDDQTPVGANFVKGWQAREIESDDRAPLKRLFF